MLRSPPPVRTASTSLTTATAILGQGLVDLAVNVLTSGPAPRGWPKRSPGCPSRWAAIPTSARAREAIAARHHVDVSMVLPTSGGAEASTLIAHGLPLTNPMVVHPQFTEPEAALRAAGRAVQRWLLPVTAGAGTPDLGELPSWADALFVGNPTNPTGWLHRREAWRPGRAGCWWSTRRSWTPPTRPNP